jgi:AcrR family transcriptional regulator
MRVRLTSAFVGLDNGPIRIAHRTRSAFASYVTLRAPSVSNKSRPRSGPGLREQNKLDKRERIRAAASELFSRLGYGAATLRQIAQRAHVGLGTLFDYAEDKRDLVFLIFNDELDTLTDAALAAGRADAPLIEQLMAVFRFHYEKLAVNPSLARILLQELTFYSEGKQSERFHEIRGRLIRGIEGLVQVAQEERRILAQEKPEFIARHLFFVYSAAIRWWISGVQPDVEAGVAELRRLLELQFNGLAPPPLPDERQKRDSNSGRSSRRSIAA